MVQRPIFSRRGAAKDVPAEPLEALHREINRLFDDVSRGFGLFGAADREDVASPRIEVVETDKDLCVTAELPGVDPKDVDVTLEDDLLTLRGEKRAGREESGGSFHVSERTYGSFLRTVRLPFAAESNRVDATMKDGVLTIVVPKPPKEQQRTAKIAVKAAGSSPGSSPGGTSSATTEAAPDNAPTS